MEAIKLSEIFFDKIKPRLHERIGRKLQGDKHVLDLGCGNCELVRYLAETRGRHVIGIDISSEKFPRYKELAKAGVNIRCIRKDAINLEFLYETMDAVVIMWALHEMEQPLSVLQEAHRVLRPGGKVVIVEFPRNLWAQKLWNENYYTSKELTSFLRKAGFKDIRAKQIERKQILWVNGRRGTN